MYCRRHCQTSFSRIPAHHICHPCTLLWLIIPILGPIIWPQLEQKVGVSPDPLFLGYCWWAKTSPLWCTAVFHALQSLSNFSQLSFKLTLFSIVSSMPLNYLVCPPWALQPCSTSQYSVCFGSTLSCILPICPTHLSWALVKTFSIGLHFAISSTFFYWTVVLPLDTQYIPQLTLVKFFRDLTCFCVQSSIYIHIEKWIIHTTAL